MKKILGFIIFTGWCLVAIYGMMHHEIWRDEMRALSIAIESSGIFQLPHSLLNEGHPILWYLLLKVSYSIFHSTIVLPVLSLLFAGGIAWLLLIRSPFPLLLSALIIFGNWCLYEYGINCRNYGIGAFLLLLFAHVRFRKPDTVILQFAILALAAQTNIYATMMAACMACWLAFETYSNGVNLKKTLVGFVLIIVSVLFVLYVALPDKQSLVITHDHQNFKDFFNIEDVGYGFSDLLYLWLPNNYNLTSVVLWLSLLVFIPKPKVLILLIITLEIMCFFSLYFRMNFLQHQGMWIYTYLAMLWINFKEIRKFWFSKNWLKYVSYVGIPAFLFILICGFYKGKDSYNFDLTSLRSDSKDAGKWFAANIKTGDIIISEPDYIMESVMYYDYHPFYLPREKVFNTFTHFTKANSEVMSLNTLNHLADSFNVAGKKTYLVLGKIFMKDTVYRYSYNKKFIIDSTSLAVLKTNYQLMDSFNNNWFCDEHYFIFKRKY